MSFEQKNARWIELYYESNEYNITYCHGKIYKILGEIPNEILEAQQLLSDIGETSDYERLIAYLETKKKKQGCAKSTKGVQIALGVCTFYDRGVQSCIKMVHLCHLKS